MPQRQSLADRFWLKVDRRSHFECWPWTAYVSKKGYGRFDLNGRCEQAHRVAWGLANDMQVPRGLQVCHACDNPPCVNPAHLWLGTNQDNMLDASSKGRFRNLQKTHCPYGHEYTLENTEVSKRGWRVCRKCRTVREAAWRQARRMAA